jgi:hypothetical protein
MERLATETVANPEGDPNAWIGPFDSLDDIETSRYLTHPVFAKELIAMHERFDVDRSLEITSAGVIAVEAEAEAAGRAAYDAIKGIAELADGSVRVQEAAELARAAIERATAEIVDAGPSFYGSGEEPR